MKLKAPESVFSSASFCPGCGHGIVTRLVAEAIETLGIRERAIAITPDLLESDNRPDGFFAINDETAAGILYTCKLVGLKVPDEVSICGFTDGAIAQSTDPKLTTVEQHGEEVGKNAFSILTDKLEGNEEKSTNRIVRTNLVVRGTTK